MASGGAWRAIRVCEHLVRVCGRARDSFARVERSYGPRETPLCAVSLNSSPPPPLKILCSLTGCRDDRDGADDKEFEISSWQEESDVRGREGGAALLKQWGQRRDAEYIFSEKGHNPVRAPASAYALQPTRAQR